MKTYLFIYLFICLYFTHTVHSLCSTEERNALNSFASSFSNFGGNNWTPTLDCCDRTGILCDANNQTVLDIQLVSNNYYGKTVVIDFTALTGLKSLFLSTRSDTVVVDLRLPDGIEQINLSNMLIESSSEFALVPSLTFISMVPSSSFDFNIAHEMPVLNTIQLVATQDYLGLNNKYTNLSRVLFSTDFTSIDNILVEICNLPNIDEVDIRSDIEATWPACFSDISFLYFSSSANFTNLTEFPLFSDSTISIDYVRGGEDIALPKKLPAKLKQLRLVGFEGSIPKEWETLKDLESVDLSDNIVVGEIPMLLIKQLYEFNGRGLSLENDINDFLHIKTNSRWNLEANLIKGQVSDDFKYLVNNSYINLKDVQSLGNTSIPWFLYCTPVFNFYDVKYLILTSQFLSKDEFNIDFCYRFYEKITSEELPLKGGTFMINYPYATISTLPILNRGLKASAKEQPKLSLPPPPGIYDPSFFDPYSYFTEMLGTMKIGQGLNIFDLDCRVVTWDGYIECNVSTASDYQFNLDLPVDIIFYSKIREGEDRISQSQFLDAPTIDKISADLLTNKGGFITLKGNHFGSSSSRSKVELVSESETIECTIIERNTTDILCRTPKISQDSNIIYNVVVKINDQVNQDKTLLTFEQPPVSSNCFGGDSNSVCSGQGQCIEGKRCQCNKGYRGVFCEIKDSDVTVTPPKNSDSSPTESEFTNPSSTSDFHVTVKEIRELDNRDRVVRTLTPVWSSQQAARASEFIFTSEIDGAKVQVDMKIFTDANVVEFANTTIQMEPGAVKYTVQISQFPFQSSLNQLGVVFNIEAIPSQEVLDNCAPLENTKIDQDPNIQDIQWIQMSRGNSRMIGKVLNRAIIDSRVVYITFQSEVIGANSVNLIGYVPYFRKSMVLDPNFSVLLDTDSESTLPTSNQCTTTGKKDKKTWAIATAVSISGAFAIGAVIVAVVFYRKHQEDLKLKKNLEQKMSELNKEN